MTKVVELTEAGWLPINAVEYCLVTGFFKRNLPCTVTHDQKPALFQGVGLALPPRGSMVTGFTIYNGPVCIKKLFGPGLLLYENFPYVITVRPLTDS